MLTLVRLKQLLFYDPLTGLFTWKISRQGPVKIGDIAGRVNKHGYRRIKIDGRMYMAHRLAWFYVYEAWPENLIDHKNTNRDNNWIDNLREANFIQNNQNRRMFKNNKLGIKGVIKLKNKFKATINRKHLGLFDTIEEAKAAYEQEAKICHSDFYVCN